MNITETRHNGKRIVTLSLSKRNLLAMLAKLEDPASHAAIVRAIDDDTTLFIVRGERDEDHYLDRTPGKMHPRTESAIREH